MQNFQGGGNMSAAGAVPVRPRGFGFSPLRSGCQGGIEEATNPSDRRRSGVLAECSVAEGQNFQNFQSTGVAGFGLGRPGNSEGCPGRGTFQGGNGEAVGPSVHRRNAVAAFSSADERQNFQCFPSAGVVGSGHGEPGSSERFPLGGTFQGGNQEV